MSTKDIVTINGIQGYIDKDGTAWLNAEAVARGWGFTQSKDGVEYVRWERVGEYLKEFGFSPQVGKDDFLPENIVYRLGFKASNDKAVAFQTLLADVILPAIRKTGRYSVKGKDSEETLKIRRDATEARLIAAKTAQAKTWMKLSKMFDNEDFSQIARTYAANTLAGKEVLSLPVATKKTMSATEVGEACGISAIRVGRIANTHGLKTDEYGKLFLDKSKYSNKTVETFRYYESVIPVIQEILESETVH